MNFRESTSVYSYHPELTLASGATALGSVSAWRFSGQSCAANLAGSITHWYKTRIVRKMIPQGVITN